MADMTSRDRVFAALERREPDRVPMLEWSVSPVVREAILPGRSYFGFLDEIDLDAVMLGFGYAFLQGVEWLDPATGKLVLTMRAAVVEGRLGWLAATPDQRWDASPEVRPHVAVYRDGVLVGRGAKAPRRRAGLVGEILR